MFSSLSDNSISLATETPSLVMVGAPKLFSMIALRPLGPRVALTAFARTLTPRNIRWRASSLKLSSFAAITRSPINNGHGVLVIWVKVGRGSLPLDDSHEIVLTHDVQIFVVNFDFGSAVFAEQHPIAHLDIQCPGLAVLEHLPLTHGDHFPEGRFLAGGIRNHDPAGGFALLGLALHDNPVVQWTDVHGTSYV